MSQMSAMPRSKATHFLDLPPEIRIHGIYEYLLPPRGEIRPIVPWTGKNPQPAYIRPWHWTALLRVNKELHDEVANLIYSNMEVCLLLTADSSLYQNLREDPNVTVDGLRKYWERAMERAPFFPMSMEQLDYLCELMASEDRDRREAFESQLRQQRQEQLQQARLHHNRTSLHSSLAAPVGTVVPSAPAMTSQMQPPQTYLNAQAYTVRQECLPAPQYPATQNYSTPQMSTDLRQGQIQALPQHIVQMINQTPNVSPSAIPPQAYTSFNRGYHYIYTNSYLPPIVDHAPMAPSRPPALIGYPGCTLSLPPAHPSYYHPAITPRFHHPANMPQFYHHAPPQFYQAIAQRRHWNAPYQPQYYRDPAAAPTPPAPAPTYSREELLARKAAAWLEKNAAHRAREAARWGIVLTAFGAPARDAFVRDACVARPRGRACALQFAAVAPDRRAGRVPIPPDRLWEWPVAPAYRRFVRALRVVCDGVGPERARDAAAAAEAVVRVGFAVEGVVERLRETGVGCDVVVEMVFAGDDRAFAWDAARRFLRPFERCDGLPAPKLGRVMWINQAASKTEELVTDGEMNESLNDSASLKFAEYLQEWKSKVAGEHVSLQLPVDITASDLIYEFISDLTDISCRRMVEPVEGRVSPLLRRLILDAKDAAHRRDLEQLRGVWREMVAIASPSEKEGFDVGTKAKYEMVGIEKEGLEKLFDIGRRLDALLGGKDTSTTATVE